MPVYFTDEAQPILNNSVSVKIKKVEILNVYLDVEAVSFNRGFYSVDITFFFLVKAAAYVSTMSQPTTITGIATFTKKVILYGSEGSVKVFCSDQSNPAGFVNNMPTACLQVTEPIVLSSQLVEVENCDPCNNCCSFPDEICCCFRGNFGCCPTEKQLYITLGIFIIVQLERTVQMMIPTYDFCIPGRGDSGGNPVPGDPCQLFRRLKFPTNQFFPPNLCDLDDDD